MQNTATPSSMLSLLMFIFALVPFGGGSSLSAGEQELSRKGPYDYLTVNVYNNITAELVQAKVMIEQPQSHRVLKYFQSNTLEKTTLMRIDELIEFDVHLEATGYKPIRVFYHLQRLVDNKCFVYEANDSTLVLNLTLKRPQEGEFLGFDIKFYTNSQIMLGSSKAYLDEMVKMMQENPDMQIKIHGHASASYLGSIRTLENERSTTINFFKNNPRNENSWGSATKLSKMRAEAVKLYLQTQGIKADRMEIEGWGASEKAYQGKDLEGHKINMRVEVEVLAD